jgi:PAS domain S-box-containing protein
VENNLQLMDCFEITLSEEKYHSLFTNMTEGFAYCKMLFDPNNNPVDFIYLEVNDAFEKLTGLSKEAVLNKKVTEIIPDIKQSNPEIFEIYGRVATSGPSERFEIYVKPLKIWLSILAYCPKHEYFAAIFQNITQHKELEEKIETYSEGLELTVEDKTNKIEEAHEIILKNERLAAIGQLAGMVGHDLRNPLCSIRSAVYVIKKKQQNLNESSLEMLNIIEKSIDYSNKIINDLLDFSREIHLEFEEITAKSIIDNILRGINIPKNVKIVYQTEFDPFISVDTGKLERVFTNIIRNAIDAMPEGGILEISNRQIGKYVEIVFADTGIGMTNETLSKIFTPLFTTKSQGMGFGLAICKRIVEAHEGTIEVSSEIGKGTKFTVRIPIGNKEAPIAQSKL